MSQITITAVTGPGITNTAGVYTDVSAITFNLDAGLLQFTSDGQIKQFALTGSNTITMTASGGNYTIVIS